MTDIQWITTFIVSLLVKLVFTPLPRNAENRQIIFMSSIALIISGGILFMYSMCPERYERVQTGQKVIIIYREKKGENGESVPVKHYEPIFELKPATSYFGGLIKDTL